MKEHVSYWNQRLSGQLHWHLEKALGPFEVTAAQFAVMSTIASGARKPSEIAEALDVDAAAVTRILDRMAEKELLARCDSIKKEDRRCVAVELSQKAVELLPSLSQAAQGLEDRLLEKLNAKQRTELLKTMKDLYHQARSMS